MSVEVESGGRSDKGKRETNDKFRNRLVPARLAMAQSNTPTKTRVSYLCEEFEGDQ